MGALTLPSSGLVYLDTNTLIYSVETHPIYWPVLLPLWQTAQTGAFKLATSELTLLESLVAPLRANDSRLIVAYEQLFQSPQLGPLPITRPILREAARLRAVLRSLRTPDALHAATALLASCVMFLTNDPGFRQVPGLPVSVLDDVLTP